MSAQFALALSGGDAPDTAPRLQMAIAHDDPMPPGPFSVGLTKIWFDGQCKPSRPYTILCGDGRAVAGHVESRACADAIVAALNAQAAVGSLL